MEAQLDGVVQRLANDVELEGLKELSFLLPNDLGREFAVRDLLVHGSQFQRIDLFKLGCHENGRHSD